MYPLSPHYEIAALIGAIGAVAAFMATAPSPGRVCGYCAAAEFLGLGPNRAIRT
jgi:hypothetical protein